MATHRYWRITITQSTSGASNIISLYEVEMRGVVDGADLCSGGTGSASHNDSTAYKLFDDNASLYWSNGGPAETCWFQYDFAGGDVEIKQLWFLPRYASQCPKDFILSSSDNGTDWSQEAAWSDITDWSAGVGKNISIPGPIAKKQLAQPFDANLDKTNRQPAPLGIFVENWHNNHYSAEILKSNSHLYPIKIDKKIASLYSPCVEVTNQHSFSLTLAHKQQQPYKRWLLSYSQQPIYYHLSKPKSQKWSIQHRITAALNRPFSQTETTFATSNQIADFLVFNPVCATQSTYWNLLNADNLQQISLPLIKLNGLTILLTNLTIRASQSDFDWQVEMALADESSWQNLNLDEEFTLEVCGEIFVLIVEAKKVVREGNKKHIRTLIAKSPIVKHGAPRAAAIDKDWDTTKQAKEIVVELLQETVDWQQIDWPITAGKLSYKNETPLHTVHNIVSAVGGVVNSRPDGSLLIQGKFPISPSGWETATPDHIFTDSTDNLAITQSYRAKKQFDKITITNQDPRRKTGFLALDLDRRQDGPNRGKTHFQPGDTTHLLLTPTPGITPTTITPSTANIINNGEVTYQVTEYLPFINSDQAKLNRPIEQIEQFVWLGSDLGTPNLDKDGQTITTPQNGIAMLKIIGSAKSYSYQYMAPLKLGGLDSFPVAFASSGQGITAETDTVTVMRNNGQKPAADIFAPLLGSKPALQARAQHELNLGEPLQVVEVRTIYRPGLAPGQLIEIHDALFGRTFRGIITDLIHELDSNTQTSKLTISKKQIS
ncbi:MAG: discoidin domain-containing protein [Magnetococcales bacterium]|nr:discoidin domain-containing protein [Magnetococcales bacterium]